MFLKLNFKILFVYFLLIFQSNIYALSPELRLEDEKLEARAMALFVEVRCLVCQGQVIENSDTEFSFSMRKSIRDRILAGKSDEVIKNELVEEFGEDILISPNSKNKILAEEVGKRYENMYNYNPITLINQMNHANNVNQYNNNVNNFNNNNNVDTSLLSPLV